MVKEGGKSAVSGLKGECPGQQFLVLRMGSTVHGLGDEGWVSPWPGG